VLQKLRLGQFVTEAEKQAILTGCPAKWHSLFQASISLHHLHACFKIYDNISIEALTLRMQCSEDECFKCNSGFRLLFFSDSCCRFAGLQQDKRQKPECHDTFHD
jgi:hypothetical protein